LLFVLEDKVSIWF